MKPSRFEYYDPADLTEALLLLDQHGDQAKVVSGGQSLVPMLNMRLARPQALVDLRRIDSLRYIRLEGEQLCIGGLTCHAEVEHFPLVARYAPLLQEAVRHIGHTAIRNRGTIGGSLAHADPAAELPAVLVALGGEVVATSLAGARTVSSEELFVTYFTTSLQPGEVLTEVRLPVTALGTGTAFVEIARRSGDFALVGVACHLRLDAGGAVADGGLALTGVGPTPVSVPHALEALRGRVPTEADWQEVGHTMVAAGLEPESDLHASASYRRHLAGELAARALRIAHARARQNGGGNAP